MVPWPRGIVYHNGHLVVLARGVHRSAGGPKPTIQDQAGTLFMVDPTVSEKVVPAQTAGSKVQANGRVLAEPTDPPFMLWDTSVSPASKDTRTDRPYAGLAWDDASQNYFVAAYSGIDLPNAPNFRKNASDGIHRYDARTRRWLGVEAHRWDLVPESDLSTYVPNRYYPHASPTDFPPTYPPFGLLNGPDGLAVVGKYLYAVALDGNILVGYDLSNIRADPGAGFPKGRVVMRNSVSLSKGGTASVDTKVEGHSAITAFGGFLYVSFRTTSQVIRLPLADDGAVKYPIVRAELVAEFDPYDSTTGQSANLIDLAFNSSGELFVSAATGGRIWAFKPNPNLVFNGKTGTTNKPYLTLPSLTGHANAKTANIAFDDADQLYICSGTNDTGGPTAGTIYRAA